MKTLGRGGYAQSARGARCRKAVTNRTQWRISKRLSRQSFARTPGSSQPRRSARRIGLALSSQSRSLNRGALQPTTGRGGILRGLNSFPTTRLRGIGARATKTRHLLGCLASWRSKPGEAVRLAMPIGALWWRSGWRSAQRCPWCGEARKADAASLSRTSCRGAEARGLRRTQFSFAKLNSGLKG